MLDFYNFVENNPNFRQISVDDILFTAYDCPLEGSPVDYWVKKNYFCYIIKGGARWKTPKEEYILKVGDAAFLQKGSHRVFKILTGEFCALLIFMPDEFITSVIKHEQILHRHPQTSANHDAIVPLNLDQSLHDYFNTVLNFFSLSSPPAKSLLNIKFKELIINLTSSGQNPHVAGCLMEIAKGGKKDLKAVMEENFVFNLKLEDFAKLSERSLAGFKRDFTKIFDTSPGKWLKEKRLEYAKFLLETSTLNVNEITVESGFENTSHFIREFKVKYQISPLQFKKSLYV